MSTKQQTVERGKKQRPTLAIVGGGITGLGLARELQYDFDITLFEAESQLGGNIRPYQFTDIHGHSRELDTGFLAYQPDHYPNFSALLEKLNIATTSMPLSSSLVIRNSLGHLLYNAGDFMRYNSNMGCPDLAQDSRRLIRLFIALEENPALLDNVHTNIEQYLSEQGYHSLVLERFIVPIMAVIWGFQDHQVRAMAANCALGELCRLISPAKRLTPNSKPYLQALINQLTNVRLLPASAVTSVQETDNGVNLYCKDSLWHFDYLVITTYPEQTLSLVDNLPDSIKSCLEKMSYYHSIAVVHSVGSGLMLDPKDETIFTLKYLKDSSGEWITTWDLSAGEDRKDPNRPVVTFGGKTFNWENLLKDSHIYKTFTNHHPTLTPTFQLAQKELKKLNIGPRLFLAGSFFGRLGNHENAYCSALEVAHQLREQEAINKNSCKI